MTLQSEQAFRRIQKASKLRAFFVQLRQCTASARNSKFPYKPPYDIRSDAEYWRRILEERQAQK